MLKAEYTGQFKKDFKQAVKRGLNAGELQKVLDILMHEEALPAKYKDHLLENSRNYKGMRECHIRPDWLLIYKIYRDRLVLKLIRTGSHSDLF